MKKLFSSISLRTIFVFPFIIQIVSAVGIVSYLSFKNSQKAIREITQELREEITSRATQYVGDYLEIPHTLNTLNDSAFKINILNVNNPEKIRDYFLKKYKLSSLSPFVYLHYVQLHSVTTLEYLPICVVFFLLPFYLHHNL